MALHEALMPALEQLSVDASELYLPKTCTVLDCPPTSLGFYREFVSKNLPCVIRGALEEWPAYHHWDMQRLADRLGDKKISVEVTPTGLGDAVVEVGDEQVFVMPNTQRMTVSNFLKLQEQKSKVVAYISQQNSNLSEELPELLSDVCELSFASECFGSKPDAINFWAGPDDAVTSLHKDHYENIYAVIKGTKKFTLLPPTDAPWLYEQLYRTGTYQQRADGTFDIELTDEKRPWIPVDPGCPDPRYPLFEKASPLEVTVSAGDVLYLPSLWYHKVEQRASPAESLTVAVNFWYDMSFDIRYNYYTMLKTLCQALEQENRETNGQDQGDE